MATYTVMTGGGGDFTGLNAALQDTGVKADTGVVTVNCSGGADTTSISSAPVLSCTKLIVNGEGAFAEKFDTTIYYFEGEFRFFGGTCPLFELNDFQVQDGGVGRQRNCWFETTGGMVTTINRFRGRSTDTTRSGEMQFLQVNSGSLVNNAIIEGVTGDSSGTDKRGYRGNGVEFYNCLAYNCVNGFYPNANNAIKATNCVSFGNISSDWFTRAYSSVSRNNASDDAAATGMTNHINPANFSTVFVSAATGDFRLKATDTDLIDAGFDISADNGGVTTDIISNPRVVPWDVGPLEFVPALSISGPSSTTEGAATVATGTGLDIVTTMSHESTVGGFSRNQTIDAQTATTLDYDFESGVNSCTPGTPANGTPLEATVVAVGVTLYQMQQKAVDGVNSPALLNITDNGAATHEVVQIMNATSNTTEVESVLALSILGIAPQDNMQYYAPKAVNGMNITWNADGTFTTDADQTETIRVAFLNTSTKEWGCTDLTITQTGVTPVVGDIINTKLSIGIGIGI